MEQELGRAGSEGSYDEQRDKDGAMLPDSALMPDETPEASTPSEVEDGMLARDVQRKTAYYDYAAEKQLSQADAKLFYQRSKLEAQKTGGSNWGNSQHSPQDSPVLMPRSFSKTFEAEQAGMRRPGSVNSIKSWHNVSQRLASTPFRSFLWIRLITAAQRSTDKRLQSASLTWESPQRVISYKSLTLLPIHIAR